jgi:hypothetical protein
MKRFAILPLIFIMGLGTAGCAAPTYKMLVNGYTDPNAAQLAPGASFFIIENKEAPNPLLEKEIKGKIARLLEQQGYQIEPYEKAEYYLLFACGIGPGQNVTVVMPDYYPYEWEYPPGTGFGVGAGFGGGPYFVAGPFFSFGPSYAMTQYDRWLRLNVVDGEHYREHKGQFRTIWVGEARSTGFSPDLRTVVNYLLTGLFQQFGKNTGKALPLEIEAQDVRVQALAGSPPGP